MWFVQWIVATVLIGVALVLPGLILPEAWTYWGVIGLLVFFAIGSVVWAKRRKVEWR